jgi:hypothetical protein
MDAWDRSQFAMNPSELIVEEAVRAMLRVLEEAKVDNSARFALVRALDALRTEQH